MLREMNRPSGFHFLIDDFHLRESVKSVDEMPSSSRSLLRATGKRIRYSRLQICHRSFPAKSGKESSTALSSILSNQVPSSSYSWS